MIADSQINAWLRLLLITKCLNEGGVLYLLVDTFLERSSWIWSKLLFSEFWFSTSMDIFQVPKICTMLKGCISRKMDNMLPFLKVRHKLESSKWKQISYHSRPSSLEVCRPWNLYVHSCAEYRIYLLFSGAIIFWKTLLGLRSKTIDIFLYSSHSNFLQVYNKVTNDLMEWEFQCNIFL
jgi:hypothetical protein